MASFRRSMQEDEISSVGSGGMGGMHLKENGAAASSSSAVKANIHSRESAAAASIAHQNEQMLQARLQRAQQALDDDDAQLYAQPNRMAAASSSVAAAAAAVVDNKEDENELAEMEDANPEDPVDANELHEHALASGYYDAVPAAIPAAAAAAGGRDRFFPPKRSNLPGKAISIEDVAKAMTADDVKPADYQRWLADGAKMNAAIAAIKALGNFSTEDGKVIRMAADVPPYAMKKDRVVVLPDSVSVGGLADREQSADIAAAQIGVQLAKALAALHMAGEHMYKTAVANHVLRHFRKKFAAQKATRDVDKQMAAMRVAMHAQFKMENNAAYQERQLQQADKRQKVGTSEGKKIDRFAEEE